MAELKRFSAEELCLGQRLSLGFSDQVTDVCWELGVNICTSFEPLSSVDVKHCNLHINFMIGCFVFDWRL